MQSTVNWRALPPSVTFIRYCAAMWDKSARTVMLLLRGQFMQKSHFIVKNGSFSRVSTRDTAVWHSDIMITVPKKVNVILVFCPDK